MLPSGIEVVGRYTKTGGQIAYIILVVSIVLAEIKERR